MEGGGRDGGASRRAWLQRGPREGRNAGRGVEGEAAAETQNLRGGAAGVGIRLQPGAPRCGPVKGLRHRPAPGSAPAGGSRGWREGAFSEGVGNPLPSPLPSRG